MRRLRQLGTVLRPEESKCCLFHRCCDTTARRRRSVLAAAASAAAQGVTGTITGTVKDAQGGVIPGATVTLISDTRGTMSAPVVTNTDGDFVVPNVTADTYTIQVEMPSFRTLRRTGIAVSSGSIVALGTMTIDVGGTTEVVTVVAETPLVQTASGERSFTVTTESVANLPLAGPHLRTAARRWRPASSSRPAS